MVQTFEGIPTTQGGFDAVDLQPATQYCFHVLAVRAAASSAPSPAQCVETLAVAATGGPTEVTVEAIDAARARVRWVDGSQGQSEHLVRQNGPVVGHRRHRERRRSCSTSNRATTASGSRAGMPARRRRRPTSSALGGRQRRRSPEDLAVIAVVQNGVFPVTDPQAEQRANQRRDELRAAGHAAEVLNTADYPRLEPGDRRAALGVHRRLRHRGRGDWRTARPPGCSALPRSRGAVVGERRTALAAEAAFERVVDAALRTERTRRRG